MNNIKEIEYKDYFVYCNLNSEFEDNVTLVYFDHAGGRNSNNESIDKNVAKNRVEKVIKSYSKLCKNLWCIVPKLCNWFQSAEIYIVLDAINSLRSRCVCFGFSMGGFGAINFSGYLNAEFVAFQPQYKLDDNVPMTPFYRSCYQNIIRFFSVSNIENNLCKNQKGLLFFDPYNEVDLYHAKEIYKKTNCNLIEIPYSGHATSTQVNRFCQIKNIIFDVIQNKFDIDVFKKKITRSLIFTFPNYLERKLLIAKNDYNYLINNEINLKFKDIVNIHYYCKLYYEATVLCEKHLLNNSKIEKLDHETIKCILHSFILSRKFYDFEQYKNFCLKNYKKDDKDCLAVIYIAECLKELELNNIIKAKKIFEKMSCINSNYLYFTHYYPIIKHKLNYN